MSLRTLLSALVLGASLFSAGSARAQDPYVTPATPAPEPEVGYAFPAPGSPIPTLDYNYWYPSGGQYFPARMYLAPRPVPLHVGYTYITYQAMAPHEFMWPHCRYYVTRHPGVSTTYTHLRWR
jgi:hypothetical protein